MAELSHAGRSMGLDTSSASTRSSESRSGRRDAGSGVICSRMRCAASVGVSMSGREDLGPVPGQVGEGDEPRGIGEPEDGYVVRPIGGIIGDDRHPVARVVDLRVEDRLGARGSPVHLDLGEGRRLESFDQHDVGALEIASREGHRIGFLLRLLPEDPLAGALHEDALGAAFVPMTPGVLAALIRIGRMGAVLDGHHPKLAAHELGREGHEQRGFAGVLPADDRDHPRRRHAPSARSKSAGALTLNNRSTGSPNARTRSRGSVPTFTSAWKPMARRSPRASCRSMAGPQAGPYTAHSGSTPPRPSLSGRKASYPPLVAPAPAPVTSARSKSAVRNGMSQATHRTGPAPDTTAV